MFGTDEVFVVIYVDNIWSLNMWVGLIKSSQVFTQWKFGLIVYAKKNHNTLKG